MGEEQEKDDLQDAMDKLEQEDTFDAEEYKPEQTKERAQEVYNKQCDAIWARTQNLNLPDSNVIKKDIYDHLAGGNLARAETKLKKLEEAKASEIDKRVEEKMREYQQGTGEGVSETSTDIASPKGSASGDEKWLDEQYSTGKSDDHARADKIIKKMQSGGNESSPINSVK